MRLNVLHKTIYSYAVPLLRSTQVLRLWPQDSVHQRVLDWSLDLPPATANFGRDCFGNISYCLSAISGCQEIIIVAKGTIETYATINKPDLGIIPVEYFLNQTMLTEVTYEVKRFIFENLGITTANHYHRPPTDLLTIIGQLSQVILRNVHYTRGVTDSNTTASDALMAKAGVCQDHTHILLSCCRYLGIPARYVSGYLYTNDAEHLSSHAWAEIWFNNLWYSFDVSNQCAAGETHVELAYGLDYLDASPIRGLRIGGENEELAAISLISQQ